MRLVFFVCAVVFSVWLTFGSLGPLLSRIMEAGIDWWIALLDHILQRVGTAPMLQDLIICGVCTGVGSVLTFVPIIAVLFFCLACWESSGALAVLSRVLDRPLQKLGLSGACAMPLLLGFGCSVPAVMEAERLPTHGQMRRTVFLIPFLSCNAKLPLYTMLAAVFFGKYRFLLITTLYLTGILLGVILLRLRTRLLPMQHEHACSPNGRNAPRPYLMQGCSCSMANAKLPHDIRLRPPCFSAACAQAWENSKAYIQKIFTVVLLTSSAIWFLEHFTPALTPAAVPQESLLATIGRVIAPLFAPLGFGDWRAAAALLTGLSAKEAIVSTLAVLSEAQTPPQTLDEMLTQMFTPLSAFSFAVFCLLYMPCIATLAAVKKALGGFRWALAALLTQTTLAWLAACLIWQTGSVLLRFFG